MKKALSIILVLALTLGMCMSLASCKKETKDHFVVGIIQLAPHPALDAATEGFKDALSLRRRARP